MILIYLIEYVWSKVNKYSGSVPGNRGDHQCVYSSTSKQLILFGGRNDVKDFNDVYSFHIGTINSRIFREFSIDKI